MMANGRRGNTADFIREAIRTDIRNGNFQPGMKLTTEMLAERYRVSRTPVREALIRLEEDGLARGTANAGYEIRQLTIEELCEIYEIREALEGMAVERIVRNGVPAELLEELDRFCEIRRTSGEEAELEAGDLAFHQAICRHCGSNAVRTIIDNFLILSTVFAVAPRLFRSNRARTNREHEAILEAIRSGNAKLARKLLANHIAAARKRLEKLVG